MDNCIFCKDRDILFENDLAIAFYDGFPVSDGHTLIISKRHVETFFDLTNDEQIAILDLLNKSKEYLEKEFKPDGFNIGLNCGTFAGQSVMHVHMHLIPRYKGDVSNPRGGVRGVVSIRSFTSTFIVLLLLHIIYITLQKYDFFRI